jgi:hypothetical protein
MAIVEWNYQKAGTWLLLVAFIAAAIILPAAGPLATSVEAFALIVILQIFTTFISLSQQRICAGCFAAVRLRSPPVR